MLLPYIGPHGYPTKDSGFEYLLTPSLLAGDPRDPRGLLLGGLGFSILGGGRTKAMRNSRAS